MKKLVTIIGVLAVAWSLEAQNFLSQSFLTVKAVAVGTNSVYGLTNLNSFWLFVGDSNSAKIASATNLPGRQWTNMANTMVTNTQANAVSYNTDKYNLFADVNLWAKRDGSPWEFGKLLDSSATVNVWSTTNFVVGQETIRTYNSPAKVVIEVAGRAVDNAQTLNFVFTPVVDGVREETDRLNDWTVGVVLPLLTNAVVVTNVPMYMYNGVAKLRLRSITPSAAAHNGDTTSNRWIYAVSLNGFVP